MLRTASRLIFNAPVKCRMLASFLFPVSFKVSSALM